MAALKHHGTEVARLAFIDTLGTDTSYEVYLSYRSDGHIMRRLVALNIHPTRPGDRPADANHDYGWKLYKRLSDPKRDTVARQTALSALHRRRLEAA